MECHSERFKIVRNSSSCFGIRPNNGLGSESKFTITGPSSSSSIPTPPPKSHLQQWDASNSNPPNPPSRPQSIDEYFQQSQNKVDYHLGQGLFGNVDRSCAGAGKSKSSRLKGAIKQCNNLWKSGRGHLSKLRRFPPSASESGPGTPAPPKKKKKKQNPGGTYSSDEEDTSEGDEEDGKWDLDKVIDDDEIPLVRFFDKVLYFASLSRINSPAFKQEVYSSCYQWVISSSSSKDKDKQGGEGSGGGTIDTVGGRSYGHNLDPRKGRSKWVKKGVDLLKRRELRKRMSRVAGDSHKRWILKVALVSRLIIFFIQLICTNLLSVLKHNNDGFRFIPEDTYGKVLDPWVNATFGGYVNWDAHFFLHISVYGYTSENIMAFFPLLPMILYIPSRIAYLFLFMFMSLSSIVTILAVFLNTFLFILCAGNIYELAKLWSGGSQEFVTTACLMFCFNPASIFFSGLYTETLFAFLTSTVILSMFERRYWTSFVCSAISGICRSNGILNVGFILALQLQREILRAGIGSHLARLLGYCGLMTLASALPFIMYQFYGFKTFCDETILYDPGSVPLYCVDSGWRMPYFYIQKKYWDVGFLGYFQLKQIPNFILAAPVLYVLGSKSLLTLKKSVVRMTEEWNVKRLYYTAQAIHGLFLTVFCFCFVHIQVSTRMIMSACPYIYALVAESHVLELETFRNNQITLPQESLAITVWCILYYLVGSVAFSLGLPWT